ncbi:hypothetical protein B0H11DRAFT_2251039 [Mycena galericulata]|nr:hypothetical protein B0H11DRAFT_2251039 [Mycena galericulata]
MQCRVLVAFIVSVVTLAVSAAPLPNSSNSVHVLPREINPAPLVGMSDVAREAEPEADEESPEARACRLYSCIWCIPYPPQPPI